MPSPEYHTETPDTPVSDANLTVRFCIHENQNIKFVPYEVACELERKAVRACNAHAGLVEALKSAEERIIELSKWANIPAEGQTLEEIRAALAAVNL